jgi:hypothetical protein
MKAHDIQISAVFIRDVSRRATKASEVYVSWDLFEGIEEFVHRYDRPVSYRQVDMYKPHLYLYGVMWKVDNQLEPNNILIREIP